MQSPEFFDRLSHAVRAHGLNSRVARQLTAECFDHLQCAVQARLEHGETPQEAELAAVSALGDPCLLAKEAVEAWRTGLWSNRHPWLFGAASTLSVLLFVVLLPGLPCSLLWLIRDEPVKPDSPLVPAMATVCMLANWAPVLAGGIWMGWQLRTGRLGMRAFVTGCAGIALAANLFGVKITEPTPDQQGNLEFLMTGPLFSLLFWPVAAFLQIEKEIGYTNGWRFVLDHPTKWLQTVLPFLFAWAAFAIRSFTIFPARNLHPDQGNP